MSLIYQPRGKAREYSPLALNLYLGCSHGCKYCYAPRCIKSSEENFSSKPTPRNIKITQLEKELIKETHTEQVLLSFIGDVYCETQDGNRLTEEVLSLFAKYQVPTAILTKGGERALKHLHLFASIKRFMLGATLTFDNDSDSLKWEPGAALPGDRLAMLKASHQAGIRTFASFEPVISPEQSINLIRQSIGFIDVYKIGKLNNYQQIDKGIDWSQFLKQAVDILRGYGKSFYIKDDLRRAASSIPLRPEESQSDVFLV